MAMFPHLDKDDIFSLKQQPLEDRLRVEVLMRILQFRYVQDESTSYHDEPLMNETSSSSTLLLWIVIIGYFLTNLCYLILWHNKTYSEDKIGHYILIS